MTESTARAERLICSPPLPRYTCGKSRKTRIGTDPVQLNRPAGARSVVSLADFARFGDRRIAGGEVSPGSPLVFPSRIMT
jgi:hypothetical protein